MRERRRGRSTSSGEECRSNCAAISDFVLLKIREGLARLYDEQSVSRSVFEMLAARESKGGERGRGKMKQAGCLIESRTCQAFCRAMTIDGPVPSDS